MSLLSENSLVDSGLPSYSFINLVAYLRIDNLRFSILWLHFKTFKRFPSVFFFNFLFLLYHDFIILLIFFIIEIFDLLNILNVLNLYIICFNCYFTYLILSYVYFLNSFLLSLLLLLLINKQLTQHLFSSLYAFKSRLFQLFTEFKRIPTKIIINFQIMQIIFSF